MRIIMREIGKILLLVLGVLGTTRARTAAIYDQRQEGKVNVQIDVKDVQIVALVNSDMLDDYTNYDYAYDYADFTIKPSSKPTTSKPPISSTPETWSTWPTTATSFTTTTPSTAESSTSTKAPEVSSTITDEAPAVTIAVALVQQSSLNDERRKIIEGVSNASKLEAEKQQQIQAELSTTVATAPAHEMKPHGSKRPAGIAEPRKRCPVGFLLKSGKCFKRRYSLISPRFTLMKLAPALLNNSEILSKIPVAAVTSTANATFSS